MDRIRHKRNYDLHSWTGVALGMFVFIVAFTGCLALFHGELQAWEDPNKRISLSEELPAFDDTFQAWYSDLEAQGEVESLYLVPPSDYAPFYAAYAHIHSGDDHIDVEAMWHPYTLKPLTAQGEGAADWLYDMHIYLKWPDFLGGYTVGYFIVGAAGIILLLSIISGVVAHTKIREEFFSLRLFRSVRLKWQDTHKVFGLWGLPFYGMVAFTGAILGVISLILPIMAFLAAKGDVEALQNAIIGSPPPAIGVEAEMLSMDDIIALPHPQTGERADYILFTNYGDQAAVLDLYYPSTTKLVLTEPVSFSGVTGEQINNPVTDVNTPANRLYSALAPLHFGTYGGIALKFLYFILGLSLAIITALGTMMWIERRLHGNEGSKSEKFYRRISKLNVGICGGLVVASAGLFTHSTLYSGAEVAREFWTGTVFFGLWFAFLGYAFVRVNEYIATRNAILFSAFALISAAILNMVLTGHSIIDGLMGNGNVQTAWTDLTLLAIGVASIPIALSLPGKRTNKRRQSRDDVPVGAATPAE